MNDDFEKLAQRYGVPLPKTPDVDQVSHLLKRMRDSVETQESGGRQGIRNPRTDATGLFQVMPANIAPWTKKYVGRAMSQDEFIRDKDAQEKVFQGEMGSYLRQALKRTNNEDEAIRMGAAAWYGGPDDMHRYDDPKRFRPDEPSFREYTTSVLGRIKKTPQAPQVDFDKLSSRYLQGNEFSTLAERYGVAPTQVEGQKPLLRPGQPLGTDLPPTNPTGVALKTGVTDVPPVQQPVQPPTQNTDALYKDFLKQTGLPDSQESVNEFNLAQKASVEGANTENAKDVAMYNAEVAAYNAQRPQQRTGRPQQRTAVRTSELPSSATPTAFEIDLSDKPANQTYSEWVQAKTATALSQQTGASYDTVRRAMAKFPTTVGQSQNQANEDYYAQLAKQGDANKVEVGQNVFEAIARQDSAEKNAKERMDESRQKLVSQNPDLATSPEMLDVMAAQDAQLLGKNQGDKLLLQKRNDYIDWLVAKGYAEEDAVKKAFGMNTDRQLSTIEWAWYNNPLSVLFKTRDDTQKQVQTDLMNDLQKFGSLADATKEAKRLAAQKAFSKGIGQPAEALKTAARYVAEIPATVLETASIAAEANPIMAGYELAYGEAGVKDALMSAAKDWRDTIQKDLVLAQNPAYKGDFVANHLAEGLAQFAVQMISAPLTGGASLALPLAEGASAQYREAYDAGATKEHRLMAATVGAALAAPEVMLNVKFLGGVKGLSFVENLTKGLFSRFSKTMAEAEARELTELTLKSFVSAAAKNGVLNSLGEYSQEQIEDIGNKALQKATYKPEITWEEVFVPTSEERKGYLAAGIAGLGGAGVETVIEKMPDAELARGQEYLSKMLEEGRLTDTEYQDAVAFVKAEQRARANKQEYFNKDKAIQASVDKEIDNLKTVDNIDGTRVEAKTTETTQPVQDVSKKTENIDTSEPRVDAVNIPEANKPLTVIPEKKGKRQDKVEFKAVVPEEQASQAPSEPKPLTTIPEKKGTAKVESKAEETALTKTEKRGDEVGTLFHGSKGRLEGELRTGKSEGNIKTQFGEMPIVGTVFDAVFLAKDSKYAAMYAEGDDSKVTSYTLSPDARVLSLPDIISEEVLSSKGMGRSKGFTSLPQPSNPFPFQKEFEDWAFRRINQDRKRNGKQEFTRGEFNKKLKGEFDPSSPEYDTATMASKYLPEYVKSQGYDAIEMGREVAVINPKKLVAAKPPNKPKAPPQTPKVEFKPSKVTVQEDDDVAWTQDGETQTGVVQKVSGLSAIIEDTAGNTHRVLLTSLKPRQDTIQFKPVPQKDVSQNQGQTAKRDTAPPAVQGAKTAKKPKKASIEMPKPDDVIRDGDVINNGVKTGVLKIIDGKKRVWEGYGKTPTISNTIEYKEGKWKKGANDLMEQAAWQGSPHRFNKEVLVEDPNGNKVYLEGTPDEMPRVPDGYKVVREYPKGRHRDDKIGSGEGAQAYGHGHYFADSESVAEYYRTALSKGGKQIVDKDNNPVTLNLNSPEGSALVYLLDNNKNAEDAVENWKRDIEKAEGDVNSEYSQAVIQAIRNFQDKGYKYSQAGAKYRVDLKPADDEYLLWDKPLSEQSEKVKKALRELRDKYLDTAHYGTKDRITFDLQRKGEQSSASSGGALYRDLQKTNIGGNWESDKNVSNVLKSLGIRGIKYLDGSSRSKGEGNYNYVIFDPNDVEIEDVMFAVRQSDVQANERSFANAQHLEIEELLPMVDTKDIVARGDGIIDINDVPAYEFVRRTMATALGGRPDFNGVFTSPDQVSKFVNTAEELAKQADSVGQDGKKFRDLATITKKVANEDGSVIFLLTNEALPHEKVHKVFYFTRDPKKRAEEITARADQIPSDQLEAMSKTPIFAHIQKAMGWRSYKKKSLAAQMEEVATHAVRGEFATMGITTREQERDVARLALAYLKAFAKHNAREGMSEDAILRTLAKEITYAEEVKEYIQLGEVQDKGTPDVQGAEDSNVEAPDRGTGRPVSEKYQPSGKEKLSQTPETWRKKGVPMLDVPYTSTTNADRLEFAQDQLDKGLDKATEWLQRQIEDGDNNHGATGIVGTRIMQELGRQGRIDELNAMGNDLAPLYADAAQMLQGLSVVSAFSPDTAGLYAKRVVKQATGHDITKEQYDKAVKIAQDAQVNIEAGALNDVAVRELQQMLLDAQNDAAYYKSALEDATRQQEIDIAEAKEAIERLYAEYKTRRPRGKKGLLDDIKKRKPAIAQNIAAKYGSNESDVMMSARRTDLDPDLVDWSTDFLSRNITKVSPEEFQRQLNVITNGHLSAEELEAVHVAALTQLLPDPKELTDAQRESLATMKEAGKNRRAHYALFNKYEVPELQPYVTALLGTKPNKFIKELEHFGRVNGYEPVDIYTALLRQSSKNPSDVIRKLRSAYTLSNTEERHALRRSEELIRATKQFIKDANIQAENVVKMTEADLVYANREKEDIRQERLRLGRISSAFYGALLKTNAELFFDTLLNLRRTNLLTGVKTHLVNVGSNTIFAATEEAMRPIAAMADMGIGQLTGERSVTGWQPKALKNAFKNIFMEDDVLRATDKRSGKDAALDILRHGGTIEDMERLQHTESNLAEKLPKLAWMDWYINHVYRLLGAEDALFKVFAFRRSLEEQAKVKAMNETKDSAERKRLQAKYIANPTNVMIEVADDFAHFMTFQNDQVISQAFRYVKNLFKGAKYPIETAVPFDRTPTNLVMRALEHLPISGQIATGYQAYRLMSGPTKKQDKTIRAKYRNAVKADLMADPAFVAMNESERRAKVEEGLQKIFTQTQQAKLARTFARSSSGSVGLFGMGVALAALGYMTGAMSPDDDDKEETSEFFGRRKAGIENRSIYIPGVGRFVLPKTPPADAMVAGATFYEQFQMGKGDTGTKAMSAASETMADILWEQPLLNSTADLWRTVKQRRFGEFAGGIVGTTIFPTMVSDIGEVLDPEARTSSGGKKGTTTADWLNYQGRGFRNAAGRRIPIWRQYFVDPSTSSVSPDERGGYLRRFGRMFDPLNSRSGRPYTPGTLGQKQSAAQSLDDKVEKGEMTQQQALQELLRQKQQGEITNKQYQLRKKMFATSNVVEEAKNLNASTDRDFEKIANFINAVEDKDWSSVRQALKTKIANKRKDGSPKARADADRIDALIKKREEKK